MNKLNILLGMSLLFYPASSTAHFSIKDHFEIISKKYSLPKGLLSAMCYQESRHNVHQKPVMDGGSYSYGICQVKLMTARSVGFTGTRRELSTAINNIEVAAKYLKTHLNVYNKDIKKAVIAYNAGHYSDKMKNSKHYKKVFKHWVEGR